METLTTYIVAATTLWLGFVLATTLYKFFRDAKDIQVSETSSNVYDMHAYVDKKAMAYHEAAGLSSCLVEKTLLLRRKDEVLKRRSK